MTATNDDLPTIETKNEIPEEDINDFVVKESKNFNKSHQNDKKFNKRNQNRNDIPKSTFADLLEPFPQFADPTTMKREFNEIAQFGTKSRNKVIKANIGTASSIGFDLLKQFHSLSNQTKSCASNEEIFLKLTNEYKESEKAYDDLIKHLESLVKQFNAENTLLKKTLKEKGIEIPDNSVNSNHKKQKTIKT